MGLGRAEVAGHATEQFAPRVTEGEAGMPRLEICQNGNGSSSPPTLSRHPACDRAIFNMAAQTASEAMKKLSGKYFGPFPGPRRPLPSERPVRQAIRSYPPPLTHRSSQSPTLQARPTSPLAPTELTTARTMTTIPTTTRKIPLPREPRAPPRRRRRRRSPRRRRRPPPPRPTRRV